MKNFSLLERGLYQAEFTTSEKRKFFFGTVRGLDSKACEP